LGLTTYVLRRLLSLVPTFLGVTLAVFLIVRLIPGDPAQLMAGDDAPPDAIEAIRQAYGLDRPLPEQYLIYLSHLAWGDLGTSLRSGKPVWDEVWARYPHTLALAAFGVTITLLVGLPLGIYAAAHRGGWGDAFVMAASTTGISMPVFWAGLLLQLLFAFSLGWFPSSGSGGFAHLILPGVTVGLFSVASVARQVRAAMVEVLVQDYIRTARAKGLPQGAVRYRHALKNALLPTITVVSLQFGFLMGGAVLTETVFAYPGLGRYMVQSILQRDYPVVQSCVLLIAVSYSLINLTTDLLYGAIDPRIKYS
jgi:peptide/nickel transport system permease protein/oligopeptide transport system permease protein